MLLTSKGAIRGCVLLLKTTDQSARISTRLAFYGLNYSPVVNIGMNTKEELRPQSHRETGQQPSGNVWSLCAVQSVGNGLLEVASYCWVNKDGAAPNTPTTER